MAILSIVVIVNVAVASTVLRSKSLACTISNMPVHVIVLVTE